MRERSNSWSVQEFKSENMAQFRHNVFFDPLPCPKERLINRQSSESYSTEQTVGNIIFVGSIIVLTIYGNCMIIISYRRDPRLREVHNLYLIHLAVCDLLTGLIVMPLSLLHSVRQFQWPLGKFGCKIFKIAQYYLMTMGAVLVMLMGLDRLALLTLGTRYNIVETTARAYKKLALCWSVTFLINSPFILLWDVVRGCSILPQGHCDNEYVDNVAFSVGMQVSLFLVPFLTMVITSYKLYHAIRLRIVRMSSFANLQLPAIRKTVLPHLGHQKRSLTNESNTKRCSFYGWLQELCTCWFPRGRNREALSKDAVKRLELPLGRRSLETITEVSETVRSTRESFDSRRSRRGSVGSRRSTRDSTRLDPSPSVITQKDYSEREARYSQELPPATSLRFIPKQTEQTLTPQDQKECGSFTVLIQPSGEESKHINNPFKKKSIISSTQKSQIIQKDWNTPIPTKPFQRNPLNIHSNKITDFSLVLAQASLQNQLMKMIQEEGLSAESFVNNSFLLRDDRTGGCSIVKEIKNLDDLHKRGIITNYYGLGQHTRREYINLKEKLQSSELRVVRLLILLALALVAFWVPYCFSAILSAAFHTQWRVEYFLWLAFLKSCLNPAIYAFCSPTFRKNLMEVLRGTCIYSLLIYCKKSCSWLLSCLICQR